jgi:menaquinone-dependent protoporphyrinogen oxidase
LFSSGPIGQPPFPPDEPYDVASLRALTDAREHRVFPGRLDESLLSFGERAMATAMRAPVGDFRNWPAIEVWGGQIAAQLAGLRNTAPDTSPLPRPNRAG